MAATAGKKGSRMDFSGAIDATVKPVQDIEKSAEQDKTESKNKGGRPSAGEVKRISLAIPAELFDGVETGASLFYKGNKTAYINALIKKDLEENLETYNKFLAIQKN